MIAATPGALLPPAARDEDGPVFREPWEARAFAMALALHEAGLFDWSEWSAALGRALREEGEDEGGYYRAWLRTLETLVAEKRVAAPEALNDLRTAWLDAAAATPHGRPVILEDGGRHDD